MTAITATESSTSAPSAPEVTTTSRAVAVRRGLIVAAPILAAGFGFMGALGDPAAGHSGAEMVKTYIENPTPLQWKSTGYHWAYAFWIGTALMVAPLVRGRGAWLATIAAVIGFAGMVTLPGMLISDWYQAAIGHSYGLDGVKEVEDHMITTMWGLKGFMAVAFPGLAFALPLAAAGLWRARLVRWWSFAATVAAFVTFMVSQATWWGAALTTVLLTVFAVSLVGATRRD
jgi:hypothetical protein